MAIAFPALDSSRPGAVKLAILLLVAVLSELLAALLI
jgi:hypothetical protein